MGQNSSKEGGSYSSEAYFQRQIELYRWRADSLTNAHICQVHFQLQQSLQDRQRLHALLHAHPHPQLALKDLLQLAHSSSPSHQQLMSFEQYICTLSHLEGKLTLQESLYVLQCLFSGYQTILGKMGKTPVSNDCCFVTEQGQVRAWSNCDYKLNEVDQPAALASEMSILRKILTEVEKLATKHTEYLHFARQFRSFMDRDILQHWTFPNARKLLNSYAYTYALRIPNSLQPAIMRMQLAHSHSNSSNTLESFSRVEYRSGEGKLQSTGDVFLKNHGESMRDSSRKESRPGSYSQYSRKEEHSREESKERGKEECKGKTHTKKLSSSDLQHLQDRSKYSESSKLNKSDYLQPRHREQPKITSKQSSNETSQQGTVPKLNKDRESTTVISRLDSGLYNHSTMLGFCVNSTTKMESDLFSSDVQGSEKENQPQLMRASQTVKQKKKLEKKAAIVNKYISYYQNQGSAVQAPADVVEESSEYTKSNHYRTPKGSQIPPFASPTLASPTDSLRYPTQPLPIHKKTSSNDTQNQKYVNQQPISKGKSEFFRNPANSHYCSGRSSIESSHARMCFTVKTVNKLLSNNEVSEHESQGSFMSQSQTSEYHGLLSNMGRSVNVQTESKQTGSHLNRSINC